MERHKLQPLTVLKHLPKVPAALPETESSYKHRINTHTHTHTRTHTHTQTHTHTHTHIYIYVVERVFRVSQKTKKIT